MKINLNKNEIKYLNKKNMLINSSIDYTEKEAFDFLDQIEDVEIYYAQDLNTNENSMELAKVYGNIYDKVQNMIK